MGAAHVDTLARWVPGAAVTAVFDADPARCEEVAAGVGARPAESAESVSPATTSTRCSSRRPTRHEELALACLAAGKPTLCEKPLATSAEGSRRVVEAEVRAGRRLLQVGFMRRFDPAYLELRAAVHEGSIGEVRAMHCLHRNAPAHPSATSEVSWSTR